MYYFVEKLIAEGLEDHLKKNYTGYIPDQEILKAAANQKFGTKLAYGVYKGIINSVDDQDAVEKVKDLNPIAPGKEKSADSISFEIKTLLSKESGWKGKKSPNPVEAAQKYLDDIEKFDPSPTKKYLRYLASQVAQRFIILPEDGPLFSQAIEIFMNKGNDWPGEADVFAYKNWRMLQKVATDYNLKKQTELKITAGRLPPEQAFKQILDVTRESSEKLVEFTTTIRSPNDPDVHEEAKYTIYSCATPQAALMIGAGSQWCTSVVNRSVSPSTMVNEYTPKANERLIDSINSTAKLLSNSAGTTPWQGWTPEDFVSEIRRMNNWVGSIPEYAKSYKGPNIYVMYAYSNAKNYLRSGPLLIMKKNDKPYMQMTYDGSEMRDIEDVSLNRLGWATARPMLMFLKSGKAPAEFANVMSGKLRDTLSRIKQATGSIA